MNTIEQFLFNSYGSAGELILRITLAAILLPHGMQKVLGCFGGPGVKGSYAAFSGMGIPPLLATFAIFTEFLAPFFLLVGFLTRPAAIAIFILMLVAMTKHLNNGFFMNWPGNKKGEGFEYHILYAGAALALIFTGAGSISIDAWIASALAGL